MNENYKYVVDGPSQCVIRLADSRLVSKDCRSPEDARRIADWDAVLLSRGWVPSGYPCQLKLGEFLVSIAPNYLNVSLGSLCVTCDLSVNELDATLEWLKGPKIKLKDLKDWRLFGNNIWVRGTRAIMVQYGNDGVITGTIELGRYDPRPK